MRKPCSLPRRLAAAAFIAATGHALAAPVINGTTISWPDDGWYQVQNAETYESLCEGGRSCEVPAGLYNVINLTTGERFERIAVTTTDVENPGGGDGVYPATIDIETATAPTVSQLAWSFNGEAVSGTSVADVDGDGVRDFVFMTSEADAAPCETQVVVLSSLADSFTLTSDDLADTVQISSTLFAEKNLDGNGCLNIDSIASAHDINGDGLEDLSVFMKPELSPPYYETFYQSSAVIFGRSTGAVVDVAALDGQNGFVITDTESPIAGVGDLNGDGYGEYSFQNSGFFRLSEVHLRAGNATMPARRVSTEILDEPSLAVFERGTSLSALGDVNGDGLTDFASSNYPHGSAIFFGSSNNVIESQPSNLAAVSAIGDHDNDGMDDILVSQTTSGCGFQGQVSAIVYGSPDLDTGNVSIDGDSMAIPRDTGIEIFTRDTSGQWQNSQMLAVDSDGHYPDRPLVLAGDYLAVGRAGHLADGVQTGAVYLYRRSASGEFALERQLAPDSSSDIRHAGQSIAFDGRTVVTSAEDGYMIVFARDDAGNWEQNAQLEPIAPNYVSPQLAVDGDRLLAGTSEGSGLINYSGVVVVFERQASGNWMETTRLVPDSGASSFGSSVNLHGNKALIGAGSSTIDNSNDYAKVASGHYYEFE